MNVNPALKDFTLSQNYPNPFNPSTQIGYQIPSGLNSIHVKLIVYDILGNEVEVLVNENKAPGKYNVEFSRSDLTSGVYFYKLLAGSYSEVKKMILMH